MSNGRSTVAEVTAAIVPGFEVFGIAAFRIDRDGRIGDANDLWCRWLRRRPEEVIGRRIGELVAHEDPDAVMALYDPFLTDAAVGLVHGDGDLRLPNGEIRRTRFLVAAVRADDGTFDHAVVGVIDLDAPDAVEIAPGIGPQHAAALRIADRFRLDDRLRDVLVLLSTGHRVATIAATLHLATGTVRNQVSELGDALGVHGQTAIVRLVQDEVAAGPGPNGGGTARPR